jgi:hypothetical protein
LGVVSADVPESAKTGHRSIAISTVATAELAHLGWVPLTIIASASGTGTTGQVPKSDYHTDDSCPSSDADGAPELV